MASKEEVRKRWKPSGTYKVVAITKSVHGQQGFLHNGPQEIYIPKQSQKITKC